MLWCGVMRGFRSRVRNFGGFSPGTGVTSIISELRYHSLAHRFRLVTFLGLLLILTCAFSRPLKVSDNYQEMFDVDLFNERVQLINSVERGDTQEEVLKRLGEPQDRQVTPAGSNKIFIYRVRCYMGPEPLSRWPRHLSATYEARFIFDQQGRVSTIQTNP